MVLTFESTGLLKPGEHIFDLSEIEKEFVKSPRFNSSTTRIQIFDNFRRLIDNIGSNGFKNSVLKIWVDGSFCTNKINPNDIDIILFYDASSFNKKALEHYIDINKFKLKNSDKVHILCINDFSNCKDYRENEIRVKIDEFQRNRIERYYRYDKKGTEKGYIVLTSI